MAFTTLPAGGEVLRGKVLWDIFKEIYTVAGVKTVDQNVGPSNVTLQDVDEVLVEVAEDAIYEFELYVQYNTGATPDLKFAFTYPDGLVMDYAGYVFGSTGTWVATRNDETAAFSPGGGSVFAAWLHGVIQVGEVGGVLQLQAAQNTSDPGNTLVEAGTMWRLNMISNTFF